jgi:hypothetical protein
MAPLPPIATLASVKSQLDLPDSDNESDGWLSGAIEAAGDAIESPAVTGRWFRTRGSATLLFDASSVRAQGRELLVPMGLQAVTYLGAASTDQPDDGTGSYTAITTGFYLDPPAQDRPDGAPAYSVSLGSTAGRWLPSGDWKRCVKVTGTWGWAVVPDRVAQIAIHAVVRSFRARQDGSGAPDLAIAGPDGGMRILRDFSPAELAELRAAWRVPVVA